MSHNHNHQIGNYNRAFTIGVALNIIFVVIEAVYGTLSGSMALIADAGHNLSDVLSLLLAWGASYLAKRAATSKRTYGYRKVTILASLISGILLLLAIGGIAWESIGRLLQPEPVAGRVVIVVATIGIFINGFTALLFFSGQKHDLNIRGAFLHMAADSVVSLGVVISGIIILYTDWLWVDPVICFIIVIVILWGTWGLLLESSNLAIDSVPNDIDIVAIEKYLIGLKEVAQIHDLHVWALSTSEVALTVHLILNKGSNNEILNKVQYYLHDHFQIEHSTIQIEKQDANNHCLLNRPDCV